MTHSIAGIDVHKKMLAVVVMEPNGEGPPRMHRRKFYTTAGELGALAAWRAALQVQ